MDDKALKVQLVGFGEVGSALHEVLSSHHDITIFDSAKGYHDELEHPDITNICFPFTMDKHEVLINYARYWCDKSDCVIIHSTVPPGTCFYIGRKNIVYSPIRGRHEKLALAIKTFTKYIAGEPEMVKIAHEFLMSAGIPVETFADIKTLEAAKILSTTYYGTIIHFAKLVKMYCDMNGLKFDDLYTRWNESYNKGYVETEEPQFVRPVLKGEPGPIGGHCVVQNCEFIRDFEIANAIINFNDKMKG